MQRDRILNDLAKKGRRQEGADPQAGTAAETFTEEEWVKYCLHCLQQPDGASASDLSTSTHMLGCCGRSDDTRLVKLPDAMKPRLIKSMGECLP